MKIEFDEIRHRYTVDGNVIQSVTQIIGSKPFLNDPYYADRGHAVHKMCELYLTDRLDESKLDLILKPYLEALKRFLAECKLYGVFDFKSGSPSPWHNLQIAGYAELYMHGVTSDGRPLVEYDEGNELMAFHPAYHYCGTIDWFRMKEPRLPLKGYGVYLQNDGKYKVHGVYDMRKSIGQFLTLTAAEKVRAAHKI